MTPAQKLKEMVAVRTASYKALVRELRDNHYELAPGSSYSVCKRCEQGWPCPAIRAADALEKALADTERLDWLDSQAPEDVQGGDEAKWQLVGEGSGYLVEHDDLRAAIDAARERME